MRPLYLGAALLLATAACAGDRDGTDTTAVAGTTTAPAAATTTAPNEERARNAAMVANAIAANPAGADSILTANGLTRDSYQQLMFDIAGDSAMSAAYEAAKRQ